MTSHRVAIAYLCALATFLTPQLGAQSPSVLYTWDNTGNASPHIEAWQTTGATSIIDNAIPGTLRVIETGGSGGEISILDGFNRVRESATAGSGGTDLTGLDWMEFDLAHSGSDIIQIQPFVQASLSFTYVPLVGFINVPPGPVTTYQVPLTGLTAAQAVYVRAMGFKAFAHAGIGDVVWTINEVRAGGTPLERRDLITHDVGGPDDGLQGGYANFEQSSILGNNGGQNQTGLSHNPDGSLQWTDIGGSAGAAIEWGNGTGWRNQPANLPTSGNTFNNREADLSNYNVVLLRLKATDPLNGGGAVGFQHYYRRNNFSNQTAAAALDLPIDGRYHTFKVALAGLTQMDAVDALGINLFSHPQDLVMNVDSIRYFTVPEPVAVSLAFFALVGGMGMLRRGRRQV